MSDVYTFGPTFRAEDSHTSRHLAEFWMIEPEISFATLAEDMALAEDYLKYCTRYVLDHCAVSAPACRRTRYRLFTGHRATWATYPPSHHRHPRPARGHLPPPTPTRSLT